MKNMRNCATLLLGLLLAAGALADVTVDGEDFAQDGSTALSGLSVTNSVNDANELCYMVISKGDGGSTTISGTPTIGGNNATLLTQGTEGNLDFWVYYVLDANVPTGTVTGAATFSATTQWRAYLRCLSDREQTIDASQWDIKLNTTLATITSDSYSHQNGDYITQDTGTGDAGITCTHGTGQTERQDVQGSSVSFCNSDESYTTSASDSLSVTMSAIPNRSATFTWHHSSAYASGSTTVLTDDTVVPPTTIQATITGGDLSSAVTLCDFGTGDTLAASSATVNSADCAYTLSDFESTGDLDTTRIGVAHTGFFLKNGSENTTADQLTLLDPSSASIFFGQVACDTDGAPTACPNDSLFICAGAGSCEVPALDSGGTDDYMLEITGGALVQFTDSGVAEANVEDLPATGVLRTWTGAAWGAPVDVVFQLEPESGVVIGVPVLAPVRAPVYSPLEVN